MVEVNRLTTPANMRWKLIDRDAKPRLATGTDATMRATAMRRPPHPRRGPLPRT
jgi:hypothetical protein